MSRGLLIVAVMLAVYALVNLATSLLLAFAAPLLRATRPSPAAGTWFWLRLSPAIAALLVSAGVVLPAFVIHEPAHDGEASGPMLTLLAGITIVILAAAVARLGRAAWAGWLFRRQWLRGADVRGIDGVCLPMHVIEGTGSLVALVGVLRPQLVVSSDVMAVCSKAELAVIAAHEAGHLEARDNLKQLLLEVCPDVLRWSRLHRWLQRAWSAAAEEAADDGATGPTDSRARIALAALLVKLARLAPGPMCAPPLSSPLIGRDDLAHRVQRLLEPGMPRQSTDWCAVVGAGLVTLVAGWMFAVPEMLEPAHRAAEFLVGLGR